MVFSLIRTSIILLLAALTISYGVELTKKYTIRLPLVAPLGGRVYFGKFCTAPVGLLLSHINADKSILRDYNVIVDAYDDKCSTARGVALSTKLFDKIRRRHDFDGDLSPALSMPSNFTAIQPTAKRTYATPLLTGPYCSGNCKNTGRLLQHYDLYSFGGLCVDPKLNNRKVYPNLYRSAPSALEYINTRMAAVKLFNWTKVAILSDTTGFTFSDTQRFILRLLDSNVEVVAEEFYEKDIDRTVVRLMKTDARIVFALCYPPTCGPLACSVAKHGFYSKQMAWVFPTSFETDNPGQIPKDCSREQLMKMDDQLVFIAYDYWGSQASNKSEYGITKGQVDELVKKIQKPKDLNGPMSKYRYVCYESVQAAIYVLDAVEKQLHKGGQTIMNYITGDDLGWKKLGSLCEEAITELNITGMLGTVAIIPGQNDGTSPWPSIEQKIDGVRQVVASFDHYEGKLHQWREFVWHTKNGKAPASEPIKYNVAFTVPNGVVIFIKTVVAAIILATIAILVALLKFRSHPKIVDTFFPLTVTMFLGVIITMIPILLYPQDQVNDIGNPLSLDLFCKTAPGIVAVGYSCVMGSLVVKIISRFVVRKAGHISGYPETQRNGFLVFLAWVVVNIGFVFVMLLVGENPAKAVEFTKSTDEKLELWKIEVLEVTKWRKCQISDNNSVGLALIAINVANGFLAMGMSLLNKHRRSNLQINDCRASLTVLNLLFPLSILLLFPLLTINTFATDFAVLTTFNLMLPGVIFVVYAIYAFSNNMVYVQPASTISIKRSAKPHISSKAK